MENYLKKLRRIVWKKISSSKRNSFKNVKLRKREKAVFYSGLRCWGVLSKIRFSAIRSPKCVRCVFMCMCEFVHKWIVVLVDFIFLLLAHFYFHLSLSCVCVCMWVWYMCSVPHFTRSLAGCFVHKSLQTPEQPSHIDSLSLCTVAQHEPKQEQQQQQQTQQFREEEKWRHYEQIIHRKKK